MRHPNDPSTLRRAAFRALALVPLLIAASAQAGDLYWANAAGGDWLLDSNWIGGLAPTATDWATLGYGALEASPRQTVSILGANGNNAYAYAYAYGVRSRFDLSLSNPDNHSSNSDNGSLFVGSGGLSMEEGSTLSLYHNALLTFTDSNATLNGNVDAQGRSQIDGSGVIANGTLITATGIVGAPATEFAMVSGVWTNHGDFEARGTVGQSTSLQATVTGVDSLHHAWALSGGSLSLRNDEGDFVNAGEIAAYGSSSVAVGAADLSNQGTILAQNGSNASVYARDHWSNTGSIVADGVDANGTASSLYLQSTVVITPDTLGDVRGTNGGKIYFVGHMDATGSALDGSRFGDKETMWLGGSVRGNIVNSDYLVGWGTWDSVSADHGILAKGLDVKNGISLGTGPLTIGDYYGITFDGDQTFHGRIDALPTPNSSAGLTIIGTLTLAPDSVIETAVGGIAIQNGTFDLGSIVNRGLIRTTGDGDQRGYIGDGYYAPYGRIASIENAGGGRIEADGRSAGIVLSTQEFINHGTVEASNGGYIALGGYDDRNNFVLGNFHNDGTILADGSWTDPDGNTIPSQVQVKGNYSLADLGDIQGTNGGKILLDGILDNSGTILDASRFGTLGSLNLTGTLKGGTLASADHLASGNSGTLDGVTVPGGLHVLDSRFTIKSGINLGGGIITVDDGYVTFDGPQTFDGTIDVRTGRSGSNYLQTLNGAALGAASQVNVYSGTSLNGSIQTAGSLSIAEGGDLRATVTQTGGHLRIDGVSSSSIDVEGGKLTGRGFVQSISNAASVQPGNSVGTLHTGTFTQTSTGSLEMEIANPLSFDVLDAQYLGLDGTLKIDLLDPSLLQGGELYRLITYGSSLTGTFASLDAPAGWTIVYGDHFVGVRSPQAVPEPSSFAILGLASLAFLRRRQKGRAEFGDRLITSVRSDSPSINSPS